MYITLNQSLQAAVSFLDKGRAGDGINYGVFVKFSEENLQIVTCNGHSLFYSKVENPFDINEGIYEINLKPSAFVKNFDISFVNNSGVYLKIKDISYKLEECSGISLFDNLHRIIPNYDDVSLTTDGYILGMQTLTFVQNVEKILKCRVNFHANGIKPWLGTVGSYENCFMVIMPVTHSVDAEPFLCKSLLKEIHTS